MITFFTIVLDGMPWLPIQWTTMLRLSIPWRWVVVEGVAAPVKDTIWCRPIPPRLSQDGTHEFLKEIASHDGRVTHLHKPEWQGKVDMCNAALQSIQEPCLLWQLDADELWLTHQIEAVALAFKFNPDRHWAKFWCVYLVGPNLRITTRNTYGNHGMYEWLRVWRYRPAMRFRTHEPPNLADLHRACDGFENDETEKMGAVFLHPAYALEKQVAFKERYYGYAGAVESWKRLQASTSFPCVLKDYLPWVTDNAMVDRI